jgi:hypothetical protein
MYEQIFVFSFIKEKSFSTYCPLEILNQQEVHLLVWLVVVLDFCHLQHHVQKSGLEEV